MLYTFISFNPPSKIGLLSFFFQNTTQKMKIWIIDFLSKCDQAQFPADLVTFTEEMINRKHHFLYSEMFAKCTSQITNPHEKIHTAWKMSVCL